MHGRPPLKIKRYLTDPDDFSNDNKSKYNHLTLQELKLQMSAIGSLNQITVPSTNQMQISQQKTPTTFMPLHPKFHMRRNPLKRLPDLNSQNNNSNGYDFHKPIKGPPIFKRSNPLFVVNSLFDILKQDAHSDQNSHHKAKTNNKDKKYSNGNQFSEFDAKSIKIQRGPRLIDSQLSRLTQQSNFSRRKIYSEEKSRQKAQEVELLTFYKPKERGAEENNQFLS